MQLASVRALKEQLKKASGEILDPSERLTAAHSFAATRAADRSLSGAIALGVVPGKSDGYRLAVRTRLKNAFIENWTEKIRQETRGEVDIRATGRIFKRPQVAARALKANRAEYYRRRLRPLRIGSSIGDISSTFQSAGTLGCFVTRRHAPHYLSLLTNNHVIANENQNAIRSAIVQPGTLDNGTTNQDTIGELGRFTRLRTRVTNLFDVALGDLYDDVPIDPRRIGTFARLQAVRDVFDLPPRATVYKVGRTTGQTRGRITAMELDNVVVEYDMGTLRFDNQIEMEGIGTSAFSDSGDSGSLIVDSQGHAIGLLFAGSDEGGSNGQGLTFAHPLQPVLDHLEVELER